MGGCFSSDSTQGGAIQNLNELKPKLTEYQLAIQRHRENVLKKAMELGGQIAENENVIKLKNTIKQNENYVKLKTFIDENENIQSSVSFLQNLISESNKQNNASGQIGANEQNLQNNQIYQQNQIQGQIGGNSQNVQIIQDNKQNQIQQQNDINGGNIEIPQKIEQNLQNPQNIEQNQDQQNQDNQQNQILPQKDVVGEKIQIPQKMEQIEQNQDTQQLGENQNDQKLNQLLKNIGDDGKFLDEDFPPNYNSLIWNGDDKYVEEKQEQWKLYKWKRLSEIKQVNVSSGGKIEVFKDSVNPNDIKQGTLGTCYLLGSLSALAENEQRVRKLFEHDQAIPEGIYAINLTKNGRKIQVIIDDYVPVDGSESLVFSKSKGNEIWVILLEKAWAKIHGSFALIDSGSGMECLRDLTGAPSNTYWVKDNTDEQFWKIIQDAENKNYLMTAGCGSVENVSEDQYLDLNLISHHLYSLLKCAEVTSSNGDQVKILQLRNPWGYCEIIGDWDDTSKLWTQKAKQQVGLKKEDDGCFWISLEKFRNFFGYFSICEYNDSYHFINWDQGLVFSDGSKCKIVKIMISHDGEHTIGISQKDRKHQQNANKNGYDYQLNQIFLFKQKKGSKTKEFERLEALYEAKRDSYLKLKNAVKGAYYVIVTPQINPTTYVDQPEYIINIYGPSDNVTFSDQTDALKNNRTLYSYTKID